MNNILLNSVNRQKPELKRILDSSFVERTMTPHLRKSLDDDVIKVIVGPRRSGKSSLAVQVLKGRRFAYFNFEDESLTFDFTSDQLLEALEKAYPEFEYILFDEIQLFPKWEHLVNRLHRLGNKLIITGSNSKLLSSELASSLTGRYTEFKLLTFSFKEFLLAINKTPNLDDFHEYIQMGGFPSVVTIRSSPRDFLATLWDAIILKDLVQRYKIRRISELKNLLYLVLSNMSSRVNSRSLSRNLNGQLTHSTINKFLSWAEGAYLCSMLHQYSFKARLRVNSDKKIYLYDNGFFGIHRNTLAKDYGRLLENHVFIELCRIGLVPNISLFAYQTVSQYEVDFYIPPSTSSDAALIQVCYSISNLDTRSREVRAILAAAKELKIQNLYLLTCDESEQILDHDGIKVKVLPLQYCDFSSLFIK